MESLKNRVAYLRGLAQGLDLQSESKEGRLLSGILSVLEDVAYEFDQLKDKQEDLHDYVEAIDDDLAQVEDEVRPMDDEESYTELECPACGETLVFDGDLSDDDEVLEITCPSCGESIHEDDFEIDEDDADLEDAHPICEDDTYPKE